MKAQLPDEVHRSSMAYIEVADRLLPGAVAGVAVGGSVALGAYRPQASDIDLIVTIDDAWRGRTTLIPRLRALHLSQMLWLPARAIRGLRLSACCDTSFVWESDVSNPVTQIVPIASHVGRSFNPSGAFDVNPVMWHQLLHGGVVLRGPELATWGLDSEPQELIAWTRKNLIEYWKPLLNRTETRRGAFSASRVEWCLLGVARLHATLLTGRIISKQAAGMRARVLFPKHAPILGVALAHLSGTVVSSNLPQREW